jgi:ATP-dependent DNA ligase
MPTGIKLDGELWAGRNNFNKISSISNWVPGNKYTSAEIEDMWKKIKYVVFDVYNSPDKFETRTTDLNSVISNLKYPFITTIERTLIESLDHLGSVFSDITSSGGEGVMLNAPDSSYTNSRTKYLLKHKIINDADGVIIDRYPGDGRLIELLGSIRVRILKDGILTNTYTNIGTGFNDDERTMDEKNPSFIKIGSIVTFSYMEVTEDSVRHPAFKNVRHDSCHEYQRQS